MHFMIGSTLVNVCEPSGWVYDTSGGIDVTASLIHILSGGSGRGTLVVKQVRPGLKNTGKRYRMVYGQVEVSVGTPFPVPATVSGSREAWHSGAAFGCHILRMPGSPAPSGEGGPPTGLVGYFRMVSVGANVFAGRSCAALFLGGPSLLANPLTYKYCTFVWGNNLADVIGASGTSACGVMLGPPEELKD